jgi:HEPN domain-containing protein
MKKLTREWVRKAESDYRGASQLARGRPPVHDLICFCSQQCAEKYLKALVEEQGLAVPRTHDLEDLLELLLPSHAELAMLRRGAKFLIQFAVDARYPGFQASKRQGQAARRWADKVRSAARAVLGLPTRPGP